MTEPSAGEPRVVEVDVTPVPGVITLADIAGRIEQNTAARLAAAGAAGTGLPPEVADRLTRVGRLARQLADEVARLPEPDGGAGAPEGGAR
jgi:hypothetical protein